jgi:hypothetical protein
VQTSLAVLQSQDLAQSLRQFSSTWNVEIGQTNCSAGGVAEWLVAVREDLRRRPTAERRMQLVLLDRVGLERDAAPLEFAIAAYATLRVPVALHGTTAQINSGMPRAAPRFPSTLAIFFEENRFIAHACNSTFAGASCHPLPDEVHGDIGLTSQRNRLKGLAADLSPGQPLEAEIQRAGRWLAAPGPGGPVFPALDRLWASPKARIEFALSSARLHGHLSAAEICALRAGIDDLGVWLDSVERDPDAMRDLADDGPKRIAYLHQLVEAALQRVGRGARAKDAQPD